MFLNINVCIDPNVLTMNPNSRIIFIGDCSDTTFMQSVNGFPASLFNPPFEAIVANIDGDYNNFANIYMNYLASNNDVNEFIVTIIQVSAIMGIPVILYLTKDEYELYYNILHMFLEQKYGLVIGNPYLNLQGQINDMSLQNLIQYMYVNDYIDVETFLRLNQLPYTDMVMNKLISNFDLGFASDLNLTAEQYSNIFNGYKDDLINKGRIIRQPLIKNY